MTKVLLGKIVGREELIARWAYCELRSSRFADSFKSGNPDELFDSAEKGLPFDDLDERDRTELMKRIRRHPDRLGLLPALARFSSFECVAWTREQLLQTFCVPGLQWKALSALISMPGPFPEAHPRFVADSIPCDRPFVQSEPVIVVPFKDQSLDGQLLLEGTLRSILFLRTSDPSARILAWIPREGESVRIEDNSRS